MPPVTLEIAAFELASARAAARSGADRIELCRDARAGGLTPPPAWVRQLVATTDVPVVAMVRSHADGWTFTEAEHAALREDARALLDAGAAGVVWGALTPEGDVDAGALRRLVAAVAPAPVVFHRAFDAARDLDAALDALIDGGVTRVLTGGGPGPAASNLDRLAGLVERAGDRVAVMPGGGVRAQNVREVLGRTGAREVHSGASTPGLPAAGVDADEVRRLLAAISRPPDGHAADR